MITRLSLATIFAFLLFSTAHAQCPPGLGSTACEKFSTFTNALAPATTPQVTDRSPLVQGSTTKYLPPVQPSSLLEWNAKCDGTTDDSAAINAALASGAKAISGPAGKICFVASTITVPDAVTFYWQDFNPNPNGQTSGLLSSAAKAIQAGNGDNGTPNIQNMVIYHQGSSVGSTCINWNLDYNVVPQNLWCQNFAIGYRIASDGSRGSNFHGINLFTCGTTDADVDVVAEPASYLTGGRLGCDGAFDQNSNAFVRMEGNWDNTKGTVHLTDVQLNKGQNAATCAFDFRNFTGTVNQIYDIAIVSGHEETAQNYFCSDASVAGIQALKLISQFTVGGWGGGNHFFNLNPATGVSFWNVSDNTLFGWADVALAPPLLSAVDIHHNQFQQPVSITSPGSGVITLTDNEFNGQLSLLGTWNVGRVSGNRYAGGYNFSDSALSKLNITLENVNCPLALQFGGSSAGITYVVSPFSTCSLANHQVTVQYYLALSNVGSATGPATIAGLPFATQNVGLASAPVLAANMTSAIPPAGVFVIALPSAGHSLTLASYLNTSCSTTCGSTPITNVAFTNSTILSGQISYLVGGN